MKDFYDLIVLSQVGDFEPLKHRGVIHSVFQHRGTNLPSNLSYDADAIANLSRNWKRFVGALEDEFQENVPADFSKIIQEIDRILGEL